MSHETLAELLRRRPFEPFAVRMSTGERYEVWHPEMALLLKTKLMIAEPDSDRTTICSRLHMSEIEVPMPV
ncbi:MAG TPA: hypothetical protein VM165_10150 [Planctomycetaceae bacterium]|nr:hypothetical protein [Planctomycetaceae bacterium]